MALIYVVEDDEPIRRRLNPTSLPLAPVLRSRTCESLEACLARYSRRRPDLVLLDPHASRQGRPAYLPRGSPRIRGSHHRSHVAHDRYRRGYGHDARRGRSAGAVACPQGTGETDLAAPWSPTHRRRAPAPGSPKRAAYPLAASEPRRARDRRARPSCRTWQDSDAFVDDNTLTVSINRLRTTLEKSASKGYFGFTHRGQGLLFGHKGPAVMRLPSSLRCVTSRQPCGRAACC